MVWKGNQWKKGIDQILLKSEKKDIELKVDEFLGGEQYSFFLMECISKIFFLGDGRKKNRKFRIFYRVDEQKVDVVQGIFFIVNDSSDIVEEFCLREVDMFNFRDYNLESLNGICYVVNGFYIDYRIEKKYFFKMVVFESLKSFVLFILRLFGGWLER